MDDSTEVRRVVDLASYQDGAIVSRIVIKQETGSVTLFAFDAGQELSEHTTPLMMPWSSSWTARRRSPSPGGQYRLRAGDMIVMPGHQPHAVKALSRFKMLLTMIRAVGR